MQTSIKTTVIFVYSVLFAITGFTQPSFIWNKNYGGSSSDFPAETIKCSEGGFITVVSSNSADGDKSQTKGDHDIWVIRLDDNGDMKWEQSYGSNKSDYACNILETDDYGFIITGRVFEATGDVNTAYGNADIWVAKIDTSGTLVWETTIGGSGIDICQGIIQASDSGYLITSYTSSNDGTVTGNHGGGDGLIVKLDNSGNIEWKKCIGGTLVEWIYSSVACKDGGYLIVGSTSSVDGDLTGRIGQQAEVDAWVLKIRKSGATEWWKTYGGSMIDEAYAAIEKPSGNFVISGTTQSNDGDVSSNNGGYDFWVFEIDKNGTLLQEYTYGGGKEDKAKKILQVNNGYIVAGTTKSPDSSINNNHIGIGNSYDVWIIHIDSNGKLLSNIALGSNGDDGSGVSIIQNADSTYVVGTSSDYVSGDVIKNAGERDYWIFKLGKWLSVADIDISAPAIKVYPTYTNNIVHIENAPQGIWVVICDMTGKQILKEQNSNLNIVDLGDFPSGTYLLQLIDKRGKSIVNRKIVKS